MHLLIPFAAPLSEAGRQALGSVHLPQLTALLGAWQEVRRDSESEWSLSPPHERALASALGLRGASGTLPWAALAARSDGVDTGSLAWGLVTPAHWHLGTDQVSLVDPASLALDEAASRAFFDAVQPLFVGAGITLRYGAPLRWYAAHDSFGALATASLDRVIGRNVDAWLGSDPAARSLRSLQSEVQMLLHAHPLNAAREALGLLPVNSFWLSGCGAAQAPAKAPPQIDDRLRGPALAEDWAAWSQAWSALDGDVLRGALAAAQRGEPAQVTLCGERDAVTLAPAARSLRRRWQTWWHRPVPAEWLGAL